MPIGFEGVVQIASDVSFTHALSSSVVVWFFARSSWCVLISRESVVHLSLDG